METLPGGERDPESVPEREAGAEAARFSLLTLLLVLALFLALFDGVFLRGETFCERDLAALERPLRVLLVRLWHDAGGVPLWNPLVNMGQPFAANPHAAVFHPLSWLFLFLPWELAFRLQVLLPLLASLAGMAFLLRTLGRSWPGTLLPACSWAFGGLLLSLTNLLPMLLTLAPVPAMLAFGVRLLRSGAGRDALGLAACLALAFAGGEPVTLLSALLLLAAATGAELATGERITADPRRRVLLPIGRVASAALLGAAMAAVVVLPGLGLAARSARSVQPSVARSETWSMPPARLLELALPRVMGHTEGVTAAAYWGSVAYPVKRFPLIYSIYPGLLITALAIVALARARPGRLLWAGAGAAGFLLALGGHAPFWRVLLGVVPLSAGLRFPEKAAVPIVFALTVLAAAGLDDLLSGERSTRRRVVALLVSAAALAALAGLTVGVAASARGSTLFELLGVPAHAAAIFARRFPSDCAAAVAIALAYLLALSVTGRSAHGHAPVWLTAVLAVDLLVAGKPLVPTRPPGEIDAVFPLLRPLAENPRRGRLFNLAEWHPPDPVTATAPTSPLPAAWGIATALDPDVDLTQLAWSARATRLFWRAARSDSRVMTPLLERRGVGAVLLFQEPPEPRAGVPRGAGAAGATLTLLQDPQPDAFCADRLARFDGDDAWVTSVLHAGHGIRGTVLVEGPDALRLPQDPAPCRAEIIRRGPGRLSVEVAGAGPGSSLLALNQTWDEAWSATTDDKPTRLWRTDVSLSAVAVPPGVHRVELVYRDRAIERARVVSIAAALVWLALAAAGLVRGRGI